MKPYELPDEQQESLVKLLQQRLAKRHQEALVKSVREARAEFKSGKLRPTSAAAIMRRIRN